MPNNARKDTTLMRATITPLASIFGSGFLIIVPILAGAVGPYSVVAMAGVCLLAYAVGNAIRHNIEYAEPVLRAQPGEATLSLERASDLALVLAYVISVSLYVHILSAFVLGGVGADTPLNENLLTTAVIAALTAIGVTRGLGALEFLEEWGLYITLLIILIIGVGFAYYDWSAWRSAGGIVLPAATQHTPWEIVTIVAGTLIVVQGFETPRYLGKMYDAATRIRATRWSQGVSTVVYVLFVALALPLVHTLDGRYDDNSLIALVAVASSLLAIPLIIAAALSQFSAAVADTLAAAGSMEEVTHGHVAPRWGYLFVGIGAIALTWSASTFEIIAMASRAFAFYYLLQCLVAVSVTSSSVRKAKFLAIAAVLLFIVIFAVPAS